MELSIKIYRAVISQISKKLPRLPAGEPLIYAGGFSHSGYSPGMSASR